VAIGHVDRLARDTAGLLDSIRALAKRNVEVHEVTQGRLDVKTSNGLLTTGMHGLVAEHYRVLVSEKTRAALGRLRSTGRRLSRLETSLAPCCGGSTLGSTVQGWGQDLHYGDVKGRRGRRAQT
jgi:DNA invertase Pin-like site-specific DNA recombinase